MFSKKLFNNNQNSSGGGSGGPTNWGSIGGDIDNQTDLKGQLNDKADRSELQQITQELNTKADVSQLADKADRSELPVIATNNNVGLVKPDGTTITITSEGVISSSGDTTNWGSIGGDINNQTDLKNKLADKADKTELPTVATTDKPGIVKPDGTTITITSEGVISSSGSPTNWGSIGGDINNQTDLKNKLADKADKSELPVIATNNNVGLVKPDGTSITITDDGTISSVGDTTIPITSLTYAETINLEVDKVYKLVATGNVTFVLPTVENPTTLSQILIQFKMANPVTINLGTTNYFKKTAPTMTTAGMYDIVYEYDALNSCWVVDAVIKGPVS